MSYTLNGQTLPTPKTFKREFMPVMGGLETIDGKSNRDFRIVKERFVLGWESLTSSQLSTILGIVALNTAVTFSVDDSGLVIDQTSVLVSISSINYNTPGSAYLAETEIELVEVE